MRKIILLSIGILCLQFSTTAQTISDALRFSQTYVEGTARTLAVGGSLNALGADFSVISSNPAGLAAYRSSEFVFTPGIVSSNTDGTLTGGNNLTVTTNRNNFALHNAGVVVTSTPSYSKWKTFNFAFGINRVASFGDKFAFNGRSRGSITDRFVELADGLEPDELDDFEAGLAYETGAIYDSNGDLLYNSDFFTNPDHTVYKEQEVATSGGITELALSLGGNLDDKLYMGVTFAIPFISYTEERLYRELDNDQDEIPFFNALGYQENINYTGAGFQAKFGFIYRAAQALRLGFSFHTPTFYKLTDQYNSFMTYDFTDPSSGRERYESASPDGFFEYRVRTPWRVNGSMGFLIGRLGFLHLDVEWQDYRTARFDFITPSFADAAYERQLNNSIENNYKSAFNIRTGGEIAINPFRIRAGVAFLGSPFAEDDNFTNEYSAGFGIREKGFYIDMGYRLQLREEGYVPYFTANSDFDGDGIGDAPQQFVETERVRHQFIMTIGLKF